MMEKSKGFRRGPYKTRLYHPYYVKKNDVSRTEFYRQRIRLLNKFGANAALHSREGTTSSQSHPTAELKSDSVLSITLGSDEETQLLEQEDLVQGNKYYITEYYINIGCHHN